MARVVVLTILCAPLGPALAASPAVEERPDEIQPGEPAPLPDGTRRAYGLGGIRRAGLLYTLGDVLIAVSWLVLPLLGAVGTATERGIHWLWLASAPWMGVLLLWFRWPAFVLLAVTVLVSLTVIYKAALRDVSSNRGPADQRALAAAAGYAAYVVFTMLTMVQYLG